MFETQTVGSLYKLGFIKTSEDKNIIDKIFI